MNEQLIKDETIRVEEALRKVFETEGLTFSPERYMGTVNGVLTYLVNLTTALEELTNEQRIEFTLNLIEDFVKQHQKYSDQFKGIIVRPHRI